MNNNVDDPGGHYAKWNKWDIQKSTVLSHLKAKSTKVKLIKLNEEKGSRG